MVLWNKDWICHSIDVEAAFLNPKLDRHIYIEWPDGMVELGFINEEEKEKYCIKLVRSMYGNVDAARQWMKMVDECITRDLIKVLTKSKTDPCMYYRIEDEKAVIMVIIHVDDIIVCGRPNEVSDFKDDFGRIFNITDMGEMIKHLGIWYKWKFDKDKRSLVANMDDYVDDMVDTFKNKFGRKIKPYDTPGDPGKHLKKNGDETMMLDEYRSIVGKLIYYSTK